MESTVFVPLCLAGFTWHRFLQASPRCDLCQDPLPLWGEWRSLPSGFRIPSLSGMSGAHCACASHVFVCSCAGEHLGGFHLLTFVNNCAFNFTPKQWTLFCCGQGGLQGPWCKASGCHSRASWPGCCGDLTGKTLAPLCHNQGSGFKPCSYKCWTSCFIYHQRILPALRSLNIQLWLIPVEIMEKQKVKSFLRRESARNKSQTNLF